MACPILPSVFFPPGPFCDCRKACEDTHWDTAEEYADCLEGCDEEAQGCSEDCTVAGGLEALVDALAACREGELLDYQDCQDGCDGDESCLEACEIAAAQALAQCEADYRADLVTATATIADCGLSCCQVDEEGSLHCVAIAEREFAIAIAEAAAEFAASAVAFATGLDGESVVFGGPGYDALFHAQALATIEATTTRDVAVIECDLSGSCGTQPECHRDCVQDLGDAMFACEEDHWENPEARLECEEEAARESERCEFDCCENLHGHSAFDECSMDAWFAREDCAAALEEECSAELDACDDEDNPCAPIEFEGNFYSPCDLDPFGPECAACEACQAAGQAAKEECIEAGEVGCDEDWRSAVAACPGRPGCFCFPFERPEEMAA